MYMCYIDESGTPDLPGNTSHFVLAGLSIPVTFWKSCDREINLIKSRYQLSESEIHTAWMLRPYLEQTRIANFDSLSYKDRKAAVQQARRAELLRLQKTKNVSHYKQTKKNYRKTDCYVHLTFEERKAFIKEVATKISSWGNVRLFAECVDKVHFDPVKSSYDLDEHAFDQIVSRFEQYLQQIDGGKSLGILVHDNNETIAKKHTQLMKKFHKRGTLWTNISNIIETPFFVDSQLTGMVQLSDLCSYAIRRYLENQESELFDFVFQRADRRSGVVVGMRHFTNANCTCKICAGHRNGQ